LGKEEIVRRIRRPVEFAKQAFADRRWLSRSRMLKEIQSFEGIIENRTIHSQVTLSRPDGKREEDME